MEKKTILIAEDNESNFMYLWFVLRSQYNVLHANDGLEAIDMAVKEDVDLVLMDVKMPRMNGLDAMVEILKVKPTLPIVIQSSYAFDQDIEEAKEKGATDYLSKPILREKMEELLNKLNL